MSVVPLPVRIPIRIPVLVVVMSLFMSAFGQRAAGQCSGQCTGDLDGNGLVDGTDLGILLGAWNTDDRCADFDGSGNVDGADLGLMLSGWGFCAGCGGAMETGPWTIVNDTGASQQSASVTFAESGGTLFNAQFVSITDGAGDPVDCAFNAAAVDGGSVVLLLFDAICIPPGAMVTFTVCSGEAAISIGAVTWAPNPPVVECGDPGAGDCCTASAAPGCDDASCCATVCDILPVCCVMAWDESCATAAENTCGSLCGGGPSNCCAEHLTPGCDDTACETAVCDEDPVCCDTSWDLTCVDAAVALCGTLCGVNDECCTAHATPGCGDPACQEDVCKFDPECCTVAWDQVCADVAQRLCPARCGIAGDCCMAHLGSGCNNGTCAEAVCDVDPSCCSTTWDSGCVAQAISLCPGLCEGGSESCCEVHATPGCDDFQCEQKVCGFDAFCCDKTWDQTCVNEAIQLCPQLCGPQGSDCCFEHAFAGCDDFACQEEVCDQDPFCCDVTWDLTCADLAEDVCPFVCGF